MQIRAYDPSLRKEWDAFVENHPDSGFGHLSGCFALAKERGWIDHSAMLYSDEKLLGVFPLFEKTVGRWPSRIRTLRSGPIFPAGPLLCPSGKKHDERLDVLIEHARQKARERQADLIRIAFPDLASGELNLPKYGYYPLRRFGFHETNMVAQILDLKGNEELLWEGLNRNSRRLITSARAAGTVIQRIETREEWLGYYDINVQTLTDGAWSRRGLAIIWDEFIAPGYGWAYKAISGSACAGVLVNLIWHRSAYSWLGFNDQTRPVKGASHYLYWTGFLDAKRAGCQYFKLGSQDFDGGRLSSISRLKEALGATPMYCLDGVLQTNPARTMTLDLASLVWRRMRGALAGKIGGSRVAPA